MILKKFISGLTIVIRLLSREFNLSELSKKVGFTLFKKNKFVSTFIFLLVSFISCNHETIENKSLSCDVFSLQNFNAINNFEASVTKQKNIFLNYENAKNGFLIPSVKEIEDGMFHFSFELKNNSEISQKLFYKIYYQNESYKFPEFDSVTQLEHAFAEENFYGSWENTNETFKEINLAVDNSFHKTEDKFRIVGNPRNETRYIHEGVNNRWQRNPRVGEYTFLLVIVTQNELKNIPEYIKNISFKNDQHFVTPSYYFNFGKGKKIKNCIVAKSETSLKVKAEPNLGNGIYVNDRVFEGKDYDKSYFCKTCGQDSNLFNNAPVEQFINYVDASTKMENIPVVMDVLKNNYSKMDYNWNKCFFTKDELIPTVIQTAKHPCQTVFSDTKEKKIIIKNPKTQFGEWKKESVGVITRHGFTYGKYRVKVKLTELLNKNGVWNGLTNAIWLITQGGGEWNFRRNCNKEGYMSTYWGGPNDKRIKAVDYTEIDFEILKTVPYCPDNSFPPVYKNYMADNKNINKWNIALPDEVNNDDANVTVACTNWDMACKEPNNFSAGCKPLEYENQTFYTHRWDENYRALTEKKQENDDEMFGGQYYYFEIEWKPTEVIWRIGGSIDKMRVVGYMNDKVTSISNNQMLLIITQEYHNTKWWPGTPYAQDNIPFPANDIIGEIYDLTIE